MECCCEFSFDRSIVSPRVAFWRPRRPEAFAYRFPERGNPVCPSVSGLRVSPVVARPRPRADQRSSVASGAPASCRPDTETTLG